MEKRGQTGGLFLWVLVVPALLVGIVTTLVSLFASKLWVADILANMRIQQVIGLGAVLLGVLILRKWKLLWVMVPLFAIHAFAFKQALEVPDEVKPGPGRPVLRLMLANVLTSNRDHQGIIEAGSRSQADVIVILELTSELSQKLSVAWKATHPYQKSLPQDVGNFGIGLYSNQAFQNLEVFEDVKGIPSISARLDEVLVVATHPLPPLGPVGFSERGVQLDAIASRLDRKRPATILVGDLNLTPWSSPFSRLTERTSLRRATHGSVVTPTWYVSTSTLLPFGLALDHALISQELHCKSYQVGADIGSDHRPLIWDLNLVD